MSGDMISLAVEEIETPTQNEVIWTSEYIEKMLQETSMTQMHYDNYDEMETTISLFYHTCTVKELMLICEYYGIAKDLRANKCTKLHIVDYLVMFETNPANMDIVHRRKNMWFFMNELRRDKFMKKFVLW